MQLLGDLCLRVDLFGCGLNMIVPLYKCVALVLLSDSVCGVLKVLDVFEGL